MPRDLATGLQDDLAGLDRNGLWLAWEAMIGSHPALYLSLQVLAHVVAQERQVKAFGGLTGAERRALRMLAGGQRSPEVAVAALGPGSGAQLVRASGTAAPIGSRFWRKDTVSTGRTTGHSVPSLGASPARTGRVRASSGL